jgi:hypothetical protein
MALSRMLNANASAGRARRSTGREAPGGRRPPSAGLGHRRVGVAQPRALELERQHGMPARRAAVALDVDVRGVGTAYPARPSSGAPRGQDRARASTAPSGLQGRETSPGRRGPPGHLGDRAVDSRPRLRISTASTPPPLGDRCAEDDGRGPLRRRRAPRAGPALRPGPARASARRGKTTRIVEQRPGACRRWRIPRL